MGGISAGVRVALQEFEIFESETQAKKNIVQAIKQVAMHGWEILRRSAGNAMCTRQFWNAI